MNQSTPFKENYHGVLSHDGWTRVQKGKITATVVNIQNGLIRVEHFNKKNRIVQYDCNLHKNLTADLDFISVGDTVSVKWNCGSPYIVGYYKNNSDEIPNETIFDCCVSENKTWLDFFNKDGGAE